MSARHTLEPWHTAPKSAKTWHVGIYDASGTEVAHVAVKSVRDVPRRNADARLIAAAPDLLKALHNLVNEPAGSWPFVLKQNAHAAIAKAMGEKP